MKRVKDKIIKMKVIGEPGVQVERVFFESIFKLHRDGYTFNVNCLEIDERVAGRSPRMLYFLEKGQNQPSLPSALIGQRIALERLSDGDVDTGKVVAYDQKERGYII